MSSRSTDEQAVRKPEGNVTRHAGRLPPRERRAALEGPALNAASKAENPRSGAAGVVRPCGFSRR